MSDSVSNPHTIGKAGTEESPVDTVVSAVVEQFIDRSRLGVAKYGTTLDREDLDIIDWIEHSKQEAMDFVLYLERLKRECQRRFPGQTSAGGGTPSR
jgi:hypothetical protein